MPEPRDIYWGVERLTWTGAVLYPHQLRLTSTGLYQLIAEKTARYRPSHITLDFSLCTFTTETVMLPLLALIAYYRDVYVVDFTLILPTTDSVATLFRNANWAYHIDSDQFDESDAHYEGGHVPALRFSNDDDDNEGMRRRILSLVASAAKLDPSHLDAFDYALKEIMENVPLHAESKVGGFLQATYFPRRHEVEFIVADVGRGIPDSLGFDSERDGEKALRRAISHGVTRNKGEFFGNGLEVTYQLAVKSSGTFEINSNYSLPVLRQKSKRDSNRERQAPLLGDDCSLWYRTGESGRTG